MFRHALFSTVASSFRFEFIYLWQSSTTSVCHLYIIDVFALSLAIFWLIHPWKPTKMDAHGTCDEVYGHTTISGVVVLSVHYPSGSLLVSLSRSAFSVPPLGISFFCGTTSSTKLVSCFCWPRRRFTLESPQRWTLLALCDEVIVWFPFSDFYLSFSLSPIATAYVCLLIFLCPAFSNGMCMFLYVSSLALESRLCALAVVQHVCLQFPLLVT